MTHQGFSGSLEWVPCCSSTPIFPESVWTPWCRLLRRGWSIIDEMQSNHPPFPHQTYSNPIHHLPCSWLNSKSNSCKKPQLLLQCQVFWCVFCNVHSQGFLYDVHWCDVFIYECQVFTCHFSREVEQLGFRIRWNATPASPSVQMLEPNSAAQQRPLDDLGHIPPPQMPHPSEPLDIPRRSEGGWHHSWGQWHWNSWQGPLLGCEIRHKETGHQNQLASRYQLVLMIYTI